MGTLPPLVRTVKEEGSIQRSSYPHIVDILVSRMSISVISRNVISVIEFSSRIGVSSQGR